MNSGFYSPGRAKLSEVPVINRHKLGRRVEAAAGQLLADKGYISPVDLFIALEILSYEAWRQGSVSLEEYWANLPQSIISVLQRLFITGGAGGQKLC